MLGKQCTAQIHVAHAQAAEATTWGTRDKDGCMDPTLNCTDLMKESIGKTNRTIPQLRQHLVGGPSQQGESFRVQETGSKRDTGTCVCKTQSRDNLEHLSTEDYFSSTEHGG